MSAVRLDNVSFGERLRGVSLEVPVGDRLAILGPSGSGKTTLLRLLAGLDVPDAGTIDLHGMPAKDVPPHRRGVGLVPQRPALYPHLRLREQIQGEASAQLLRIAHLLDRYPHELSGGEKQRAMLAKVAARQPALWLLDEPFAPLDPVFRSEFRDDLHLLLAQGAATMVLVSHDPIDALALGRRVGVLADGRLVQLGTPEELSRRPGNRFVAVAFGQCSFLDGTAQGNAFVSDDGLTRVPTTHPAGTRLTLGIRPSDVLIVPGSGRVLAVRPDGRSWLATVQWGAGRLRAACAAPPEVGSPAAWTLPAEKCLWFDATGDRID